MLYAMLILRRCQHNPTDKEAIGMVCPFIWVLKYIWLILLSLTRYSFAKWPPACRWEGRRIRKKTDGRWKALKWSGLDHFPTDDCAYIAFIFQSCPASVAPSNTEHRLPYVSDLIQFH